MILFTNKIIPDKSNSHINKNYVTGLNSHIFTAKKHFKKSIRNQESLNYKPWENFQTTGLQKI